MIVSFSLAKVGHRQTPLKNALIRGRFALRRILDTAVIPGLDYLERQLKFAGKNKTLRTEAKVKISPLDFSLGAWPLLAEFPLCPLPKLRLVAEI